MLLQLVCDVEIENHETSKQLFKNDFDIFLTWQQGIVCKDNVNAQMFKNDFDIVF